jgi:hypothetical protein
MKLPDVVHILGHDYNVDLVGGLVRDLDEWGKVNTCLQVIQIDAGVAPSQQWVTMIHEIMEIVNECLALDLEHRDLQAISAALFAILADNTSACE